MLLLPSVHGFRCASGTMVVSWRAWESRRVDTFPFCKCGSPTSVTYCDIESCEQIQWPTGICYLFVRALKPRMWKAVSHLQVWSWVSWNHYLLSIAWSLNLGKCFYFAPFLAAKAVLAVDISTPVTQRLKQILGSTNMSLQWGCIPKCSVTFRKQSVIALYTQHFCFHFHSASA